MDKIETPEEFREFVDEVMALGWRDQELPGEGDGEIAYAKVAARDAAIRNECVERAIECLKNNYQDWPNIITGMHQLRAAIMAEPEEGV